MAVAAFSLTGCEMMHYLQPYQWGKLNRGIGGFGAEAYSLNDNSQTAYFASVTDDIEKTTPVVAKKPAVR